MMDTILFLVHSTLLLVYGVIISFSFTGLRFNKENALTGSLFFVCCGLVQLVVYLNQSKIVVESIYPLITHLPLMVLLIRKYHKSLFTSFGAVTTAYLCCQPANWVGLVIESISMNTIVGKITCIIMLIVSLIVVLAFFSSFISSILSKHDHNFYLFITIPGIYYIFDYSLGTFIQLWHPFARIIVEFLPFFVCVMYLIFSSIYYKEHESKVLAEKKEQIIQLSLEQQTREFDLMKENSQRMRLLRHDQRLLLNNIALSIQSDDKENALQLISSFISEIDSTVVVRYCEEDIINYVLSSYASKCASNNIQFETDISITDFNLDPMFYSSILSNALDNALNAQDGLDDSDRIIKVMIKNSDDKLLLSVRNHYSKKPILVDGLPVTTEKGHGYGTQSIRYMTERLGGNFQFSIQDNWFVTCIVI